MKPKRCFLIYTIKNSLKMEKSGIYLTSTVALVTENG